MKQSFACFAVAAAVALGGTCGVIAAEIEIRHATDGLQTDNSNPTDFTYVLTPTGANTAALRVQFKSDKWDEYDLTYTNPALGRFVRRQYDQGVLEDTDMGGFHAKSPAQ